MEKLFPDTDCRLVCDTNQLQQALIALFINAVDAMPNGGTIRVEVIPEKEKNSVQIKISDNGVGISEESISNIFEPFFTTKKDGQGVGLGLSVVYGIIKKHDGEISVDSKINQGTTFTIILPTNLTVGEQKVEEQVA
ncbi:MAG: hypothetical protein A2149_00550 [Candidatus Schekmanbacteria bacterium RBG_16_38_11]|uniref:histidine kinase n=1 Tax=Candidatus Schekmanbacteria bacterium RBG_16_38_11 TaxID=1817880 RepID=A0A1F7RS36_9BACT|nr:MAG: hypothetical protein A2149_00550 [Candidatus Schekmanbacteria bacterium RBG_16_38_11]